MRGAFIAGVASMFLSALSSTAADGWLVDFEKAKAQAAKEGKSILMEFTGSDWCPPCKALAANVFAKDVFKTEIPKHFVLLKLDNPQDKSHQSEAEKEQYVKLSKEYPVPGVPTIYLTDATGRPYYQTVGYAGNPADEYVKDLKSKTAILKTRNASFDLASKAEGKDKAHHLASGLKGINEEVVLSLYTKEVDQIIALDDTEGKTISKKFVSMKRGPEIRQKLAGIINAQPEADVLIKQVTELVEKEHPVGEVLQEALYWKGAALFQSEKKEEAKGYFIKVRDIAPTSRYGQQASMVLARFFPDKK